MHARLGMREEPAGCEESDKDRVRREITYYACHVEKHAAPSAARQRSDHIYVALAYIKVCRVVQPLQLWRVNDLFNGGRVLDLGKRINDRLLHA
jgi:hypothetical protein